MTRIGFRAAAVMAFAAALLTAQPGGPIPQQLTFTPYHATGIYDIGETVGWTVTPGPVEPAYSFKWTIRRNNAVVLKEGKLDLSSGKDTIEIKGEEPEMIYVAVEPVAKLVPDATPTEPAPAAPGGAVGAELTPGGTRAGIMGCMPWAPRLRPRRSVR
jgi:hypothetical protein